eukprot:jgi/Tetstr1/454039/TSEL_040958.t1
MSTPTQQYLLRMNDGRQFTDYTPRGSVPLPADRVPAHEAKNHMIAHADEIIQRDRQAAASGAGVSLDVAAGVADVPGFEITQMCDSRTCAFASAEPVPGAPDSTGLGTVSRTA